MYPVLEIIFLIKLKKILQSKYLYILLIWLTIITCFAVLKYDSEKINKDKTSKFLKGIITDIKRKEYYNTLEIKGKEKILVYDYKLNKEYNIGDTVLIEGEFKKVRNNTNFYLFNYKNYLKSRYIYYTVNLDSIKIIKAGNIFYKIKNLILNRIDKINNPYLNAFLLGDTSKIDKRATSSYQTCGISHLFAVSGMHVSLFTMFLMFFLSKFIKGNFKYIIVFIFLLFYAFLTNYSKSVLRATIFYFLISLNNIFKINLSSLKVFLLLFLVNLIINPYNLYNTAFLFSYIIALFLIIFGDINRYRNYFVKVFITSLIAFISSLPILINSYFNVNLLSPFINIIFVPFVSLILFPVSIITFIFPFMVSILNILTCILEKISIFISNIDNLNFVMSHLNVLAIIIYYAAIIVSLIGINKKRYYCILPLIIIMSIHHNYAYINPYPRLIMLDVNQGDSTLIVLPHNKGDILIDTGGIYKKDIVTTTIIPALKSNGIKSIDYLILTHGDYDHMGEAISLVENFRVEKVIFNCGEFNDLENELIKVLDEKKIPYYSCIKELNIDNNKLYFLNNKDYGNENDNSSVIYTELNDNKFLFMGDAGIEVEEALIKKYNLQDIDVLKVGHHGSKTSTGKEFINEIKPKYSVISVGKNNRYGHPNDSVLDNLSDFKIYRTDQDGSIMLKIKNNKLKVETCPP